MSRPLALVLLLILPLAAGQGRFPAGWRPPPRQQHQIGSRQITSRQGFGGRPGFSRPFPPKTYGSTSSSSYSRPFSISASFGIGSSSSSSSPSSSFRPSSFGSSSSSSSFTRPSASSSGSSFFGSRFPSHTYSSSYSSSSSPSAVSSAGSHSSGGSSSSSYFQNNEILTSFSKPTVVNEASKPVTLPPLSYLPPAKPGLEEGSIFTNQVEEEEEETEQVDDHHHHLGPHENAEVDDEKSNEISDSVAASVPPTTPATTFVLVGSVDQIHMNKKKTCPVASVCVRWTKCRMFNGKFHGMCDHPNGGIHICCMDADVDLQPEPVTTTTTTTTTTTPGTTSPSTTTRPTTTTISSTTAETTTTAPTSTTTWSSSSVPPSPTPPPTGYLPPAAEYLPPPATTSFSSSSQGTSSFQGSPSLTTMLHPHNSKIPSFGQALQSPTIVSFSSTSSATKLPSPSSSSVNDHNHHDHEHPWSSGGRPQTETSSFTGHVGSKLTVLPAVQPPKLQPLVPPVISKKPDESQKTDLPHRSHHNHHHYKPAKKPEKSKAEKKKKKKKAPLFVRRPDSNRLGLRTHSAGCAAAMKCMPKSKTDLHGNCSEKKLNISDKVRTFSGVPLMACNLPKSMLPKDAEADEEFVCCRDKFYKDPWPMNGN